MGRYNGDSGLFTYAEYKNRGVIKLAPDVLVFISGNTGTTVIAPVHGSTQKVDFRDGISSINVQNNVDPPGSSSASIEIIAPLQDDKSNYWVTFKGANGQLYKYPYFSNMMEVKIWFRGRFLVNGETKYYPAFWGFITNVEESFSGGMYKFNLQCADMLHWWSYVQTALKLDVAGANMSGTTNLGNMGSRFDKANAFEIIYALTEDMQYQNFIVPEYVGTITSPDHITLNKNQINTLWKSTWDYWRKRFSTKSNLLRMYGAAGRLIKDPKFNLNKKFVAAEPHPDSKTIDDAMLANKSSWLKSFLPDDHFTSNFQVFFLFDKFGLNGAEYMSKLDIAQQVKTAIEYEFFQDVNGNFVFKPPFYNLNTKNILTYRIKPNDIINYSFGINSDEIVTSLEVKTGLSTHLSSETTVKNVGYYVDLDMVQKYGERHMVITPQYLNNSNLAWSLAVGHLSLINAKATHGSVTIPGRPELKLGYPVYIEHKDRFYYVISINHAFDFGGNFTTTLSLNAERNRIYDQNGSSQWEIQKNKIYIYENPGNINPNKTSTQEDTLNSLDPTVVQDNLLRGAGIIKSHKIGQYKIDDPPSDDPKYMTIQTTTIPYTDDEGYRVIGSFKYGRGVIKAGDVLDSNGLNQSIAENQDPKAQESTKQSLTIINMKAASDEENNAMTDYFKTSKSRNEETIIPEYLETSPVDTLAQVDMVLNSVPKGVNGTDSNQGVPLTGKIDLDTQNVTKYTASKQNGVPALTGTPQQLALNVSQFDNQVQAAIDSGFNKSLPHPVTANEIEALMMQESGGRPDAVSPAGAVGLTQITPAALTDVENALGPIDLTNTQDQIKAGVYFYGQQKKIFNGDTDLSLAAYNAGTFAVQTKGIGSMSIQDGQTYIKNGGQPGVPPFLETENYVASVKNYISYLNNQNRPPSSGASRSF